MTAFDEVLHYVAETRFATPVMLKGRTILCGMV